MLSDRRLTLLTSALLILAALTLVACSRARTVDGPPRIEAPGSSTSTSATIPSAPAPGAASNGSSAALSPGDAKALDAELSAIQGELDKMSLPSDSDFKDLESGLQ